ncbi:MAG: hypothetical protein ACK5P5_01220 [Pseudobdellovibrionaceae bacterium]
MKLQKVLSKVDAMTILKLACALIFFGRAWQHLVWDSPLRSLLWDESLMEPLVQSFGVSWNDYVTNAKTDEWIQNIIKIFGVVFLFAGISSFFVTSRFRIHKFIFSMGSVLMLFVSFLYFKEKFFQIGELMEYAIQFGTPVALLYASRKEISNQLVCDILRAAVALTFLGHGLYAVGYYPVPGHFLDMTMSILQIQNEGALLFLKIAGIIDFLIAISLMFGIRTKEALAYATFWGLVTAAARPISNVSFSSMNYDLAQWLPEMVFRLGHGLVPLALLLITIKSLKEKSSVYNPLFIRSTA